MPGLYVADFTSVAPMGAQNTSASASASKPADQAFGKALHQASRPEPKHVRQDRPETACPQGARERISAREPQPHAESTDARKDEAKRPEVSASNASGERDETTPAQAMAPFYMAALFDQSARYLQPSAQSEGVAAAERVQEFVASWLQTQATENSPMAATAPVNQPKSPDVISMALDILNQYVVDTLGPATAPQENATSQVTPDELLAAVTPFAVQDSLTQDTEETLELTTGSTNTLDKPTIAGTVSDQQVKAQLSEQNAAELRQLMALMMQSGRIPEPFNQQPGNKDLQQQLDRILPLVISASSAAAQATTDKSVQAQVVNQTIPVNAQVSAEVRQTQVRLSLDPTDESSVPKPSIQPSLSGSPADPKTGLQESQLAKIFAAPSAHSPSEQKVSELTFATPPAGRSEESAAAGQPETSEVKFAAPQQQRADTFIHMVANGPRTTLAVAPGDSATVKLMQLPSGQQLPETRLVDQVVSHLAAGNNGETSRMLLRLNPAELGSLRIELTMEGDKLRAQLHAQTQQVQEVLDRHLPQLRDALQMQGLKIDSFRVDVQGGHSQARDQASQWQQPQHQGQQGHQSAVTDWPPAELDIPLQQILQQPAGSISLRV